MRGETRWSAAMPAYVDLIDVYSYLCIRVRRWLRGRGPARNLRRTPDEFPNSTNRRRCAQSLAVDQAATTEAPVETEAPASTDAPVETDAPAVEELGTIVDVAVANGSFTTLVAAVEAAGLVETLSGEGPFTVFAPTDDAFDAALGALDLTADELLADADLLTSVLTYHAVPGEVLAESVLTLDGQPVATVNGVIHVIDTVLLPPA